MVSSGLPVILGAGGVGDPKDPTAAITTIPIAQEYVDVFRKYGGTTIDTSRKYTSFAPGSSEALLGSIEVASWATIDTKVFSDPGHHTPEKIAASISESLSALKVDKVHLMYLHYPDRSQSLDSVVSSMARAIEAGHMEHWAVSNYSIEEVKQILSICDGNQYPKPVVYQGHFNPLTRKMEDDLLPLLRENRISFYAYSPAAGGAFSERGTRKGLDNWLGNFSRANYHSSNALTTAIRQVQVTAAVHGLTGHEAALRWVQHHSVLRSQLGDAMIISASSPAQLEKTMAACTAGPLPEEVAEAVEGVWKSARDTAPDYSPFLGDFDLPSRT